MFQNILAVLGLAGGLLGAYATYLAAKGKNKTDIGAIVNDQIKTILANKDRDIDDLKEDNETTKKEMKDLRVTVKELNEKVEQLLLKRIEDEKTIGTLTFELKQKTIELASMIADRDYWKSKYHKLKGEIDNEKT